MKNWKWWVFGGCSICNIISLIICIITICSFESYNVDKTSMLMSGFSILVSALVGINALLIGWQIFNYFTWKNTIQEIVDNGLTNATSDYTKYVDSINHVFTNCMLVDNSHSAELFDTAVEELLKMSKCKNKELMICGVNFFFNYLYHLGVVMKHTNYMRLFRGKKDHYHYIVSNVSHEHQSALLKFLDEVTYEEDYPIEETKLIPLDGGFYYE